MSTRTQWLEAMHDSLEGKTLEIDTYGETYTGTFTAIRGKMLSLTVEGRNILFPLHEIKHLFVNESSN